ncbi:MAG: RlmE family RNA methyltransferase [Candidatus Bathyarchaeia archaeon]
MASRRILERRKDYFYRLAKEKGYRSRAAFKLLEIVKIYRLIKPGYKVVDLGAAPGGWLQVTSNFVGKNGYVLGIDVKPIEPLNQENVETLTMDIEDPTVIDAIMRKTRGKVNVALSDISPKISGIYEMDHYRQICLAKRSLEIARSVLIKGGAFFIKVFDGPELKGFIKDVKESFKKVKLIKPKASRSRSSELYVLGMEFKG